VKASPAIIAALAWPCVLAGLAFAADPADDLKTMPAEWTRLPTYDALERVPVRGWGDNDLQATMRRVAAAMHRKLKPPADQRLAIQKQGDAAWARVVETLHLAPAATVLFDASGRPRAEPPHVNLALYAGVPSAAILRVEPCGADGRLVVSALRSGGIESEGCTQPIARFFTTYAVVTVTAAGQPGRRQASLAIGAAGRQISVPVTLDVRRSGTLKCAVTRKGDGAPLAAKLMIEDSEGRLYVVPGERNYRTQSWYAYFQPRFSLVEKTVRMPLPPGRYRVTAMKGYGYRNWEGTVEVKEGETATCTIAMERLVPIEDDGWFAGDMHLHGKTPLAILRAEDVNLVCHCHYSSDKPRPLGVDTAGSDAAHIQADGQEIEHWNFGNAFYFGIPTTVLDPQTPEPRMTPFFHYDEQARRMGGITIRWLRARPFAPRGNGQQQPELAVDAALGLIDSWSVMDNSMQNLLDVPGRRWSGDGWGGQLYEHTYKTWYALLNCGLRVTASAGTSYGRLSRLGFNRVYVRCPEGLSVKSFAAALERGDGFVTNGPLLWLKVNSRLPGEGLALEKPGEVKVSIRLAAHSPLDMVELVRNGQVVARRNLQGFDGHFTYEPPLRIDGPCWLAARCFGTYTPRYPHSASHNHFAHTNPLFVTVGGKTHRSPRDAARFIKEIDALIAFVPNIPTEGLRSRSLEAFRKARKYFADIGEDQDR